MDLPWHVKSLVWRIESAYWWNWCGDHQAAREQMIEIADKWLEDPPDGKRKLEEAHEYKEEKQGDYWETQRRIDAAYAASWGRSVPVGDNDAGFI